MRKLLPGHISVYAFAPEAITDWLTPNAAELEDAITAGMGWDISCAISSDGYTLGATGYATDDSTSICDFGNVDSPTFIEYEASLDGFRSDPVDPTAVYDTFFELFSREGRNYVLIERVGPEQGTPIAGGDVLSLYGFETDYGTDVVGDNSMIMWGARFKPTGSIATNRTAVAS